MTTDQLPALIDRARNRLAEARTSAEVLEAKHVGESALHYAKVTGAANEVHADCVRIITRCEIRLAREIDAAQERGEVDHPGSDRRSINVQSPDNGPASMKDLGLDRRRVAEWRDLAEAGEAAVDGAIDEAVAEARVTGRTVTKHAVQRKIVPKRKRPPVIPAKPPELVSLELWLRRGDVIAGEFARRDDNVAAYAAAHGTWLIPAQLDKIGRFLAELRAGLEADRDDDGLPDHICALIGMIASGTAKITPERLHELCTLRHFHNLSNSLSAAKEFLIALDKQHDRHGKERLFAALQAVRSS